MPRNKTMREETRGTGVREKEEEKETEEEDLSPKKVASDDDEVIAGNVEDPLPAEETDEDDPLTDFMSEEESW